MRNPIFKFNHPGLPNEDLFFILNLDSELSETLPMDLTTFVWYYLDSKQSLEYLFTEWENILKNSTSIPNTSFENYFSEFQKKQLYSDAEFANSIEFAKQNITESNHLKKLLNSKKNQIQVNRFDFSFINKDIKFHQGRHYIDIYLKSNFGISIKEQNLISDREIIISLVMQGGLGLDYASDLLKSELELIKIALKYDFRAIYFAHDSIKEDRGLLNEALKYDREFCISIIYEMFNEIMLGNQDYEHLEDTLEHYFYGIWRSSYFDYLKDSEIDLSSWVLDRPIAYNYLKDDDKYVLDLFEIWPDLLNFKLFELASKRLLNSKDFILQFFKSYEFKFGLQFEWSIFPSIYWVDREVVFEVVKKYGYALEFASEELKNDREIVFEAVKNNVIALKYVSDEFKNNREFVFEAVKENGEALEFASDQLKNDCEIVFEAVKNYGPSLKYTSKALQNAREIVFAAVKNNGFALQFTSDELKNDREIVYEAVKRHGRALEYVSDELKNDREIVYEAVKRNGWALKYVSDDLKNNSEIVFAAVKNNGFALQFTSDELKNDREIVFEAVKNSGRALEFASDDLKNDLIIALEAVKEDEHSILFVGENIREEVEEIINSNTNDDEWTFDEEE